MQTYSLQRKASFFDKRSINSNSKYRLECNTFILCLDIAYPIPPDSFDKIIKSNFSSKFPNEL